MDKINFENLPSTKTPLDADNLNDMQSNIEKSVVATGKIQPSTGEKVWLKTGKNLFNKNNVINGYRFGSDGSLYADSDYSATDFIEVNSSTQYTVSWVIQIVQCVCYYDENKNFISRNGSENPFTTPASCKYIRASVLTADINSAQIEQGSTATTYQPYVEKEILVKNGNGVFEKFYNEEEINQENYSLGEQKIGTWIDGKPLYRRIYQFNLPQCTTSGTPVIGTHTIENASYAFIEFGHIYADFINAPAPYVTRQNPSWNIGIDLTSPNTLRIWNSYRDWNAAKILVSVLYTK